MGDAIINTSTGPVKNSELARAVGTKFFDVYAASITASADWQGLAVRFMNACVVTIPADLPSDFSCGWSQESAGAVTFQAGDGATLQSQGNLHAGAGQFAIGGLSGWGTAIFRLFGSLA